MFKHQTKTLNVTAYTAVEDIAGSPELYTTEIGPTTFALIKRIRAALEREPHVVESHIPWGGDWLKADGHTVDQQGIDTLIVTQDHIRFEAVPYALQEAGMFYSDEIPHSTLEALAVA